MASQNFLLLLFLTSTPCAFGESETTTTPHEESRGDTETMENHGHLTIIYFCLTSLLFFHVSCVLLAFILCVRHSAGECRFFGRSSDVGNERDRIAGGVPHRENSFSVPKSLQKDLLAVLDGNGSPYILKYVAHGTPPGQSEEIAFVGYNLPDINELNKKKEQEDQKQKTSTSENTGKTDATSPVDSESSSSASTNSSCPSSTGPQSTPNRDIKIGETDSLGVRIPDFPPPPINLPSPSSSSPVGETGSNFLRYPLRFSMFLPSKAPSAHVSGPDGAVTFSGSPSGLRQKRSEQQVQRERGATSLTSRIVSCVFLE